MFLGFLGGCFAKMCNKAEHAMYVLKKLLELDDGSKLVPVDRQSLKLVSIMHTPQQRRRASAACLEGKGTDEARFFRQMPSSWDRNLKL